jgi:RNA polymerase sigma-70 factor (ECF subfamily)
MISAEDKRRLFEFVDSKGKPRGMIMSSENEEIQLIEEAKKGDLAAFEKLILSYEKMIYNYCLRMTNSREDAEDLTQEVFIRLYKSLKRFRGRSKFSTYVYRIAHNICIDHYRKSKVGIIFLSQPKNSEDDREMDLPAAEPSPEETALQKEQQELLLQCIAQLKPNYRTIIVLREIQERSYEEIAEILNMPLGTVKSHLSRARTALREAVRPLLKGGDGHAL